MMMNKYSFLRGVCDVIFFSAILLNLGALGLTNIVVVKENPQAVVLEANPITAQAHGYVVHPETAKPKNFLLKTYLPLFLSALSMA
jgi:hypothetical protein